MKKKSLYKRIWKITRRILFFPYYLVRYVVRDILIYRIHISKTIKNCKIFYKENWSYPQEKTIIIFQYSFYDLEGNKFFAGGAEKYVLDLANVIQKLGYHPLLIQRSSTKNWKNKKLYLNENLDVFGIKDFKNYNFNKIFFKAKIKSKFFIYSGLQNWRKSYKNSIMISHGISWDSEDIINISKIKNMLLNIDNLISVDTNTISFLRTAFKELSINKNFFYIPNYVDCKTFTPNFNKSNDKIKILYPRRLVEERGYYLCSNIIDKVMNIQDNIEFDFVGFIHNKEVENDLEKIQNKYSGRVHYYFLEPDEMKDIYKNYDISLIPTICSEGTSLSCLEAQASGNAVIATNIGGLPNLIIDGYNGLLINPKEDELFDAIKKLALNEELRNKLSKNAIDVSKSFDKSIWEEKWKNILVNFCLNVENDSKKNQ